MSKLIQEGFWSMGIKEKRFRLRDFVVCERNVVISFFGALLNYFLLVHNFLACEACKILIKPLVNTAD